MNLHVSHVSSTCLAILDGKSLVWTLLVCLWVETGVWSWHFSAADPVFLFHSSLSCFAWHVSACSLNHRPHELLSAGKQNKTNPHTLMDACTFTHIYIYTNRYVYLEKKYIYICARVWLPDEVGWGYKYIYICIHTYMHACIHTSIHTYIHTYIIIHT